ncbi:hypothetical protein QX776_00665 [Alteromonadaceae bacterium BrNp21-10]|nr:hypothetical protein [Alteromonadaceae bacterium BrNp21-10]
MTNSDFLERWKNINFAVIVSTGRTGTEFFSHAVSTLYPNALCLHEPRPDAFYLGVERIRNSLADDEVVNKFLKMREPILEELTRTGKTNYIESNNNLAMILPALLTLIPALKVIHIIRKPESYIISAMNNVQMNSYTLLSDQDARPRLCAKDYPNDPFYNKWPNMSQFERLCWHWVKYNRMIEAAASHSKHYCKVLFEDVFASKDKTALFQILDFLQLGEYAQNEVLSIMANKKNSSAEKVGDKVFNWDENLRSKFETIIMSSGI